MERQPSPIVVRDYDPAWPHAFQMLSRRTWTVLSDLASGIEHVGSTAVPGLAAKPIIDIDVVVDSEGRVPDAIARLATLGYEHIGNRGIPGREAFRSPDPLPVHHLYLCTRHCTAFANHIAFRDYLRSHPEAVRQYSELKKSLARQHPSDIDRYVFGKTAFILVALKAAGLSRDALSDIQIANTPRNLPD